MSGLTALDAHFADGNVPLGVMLGAISALDSVRKLLPDVNDAGTAPSYDDCPSTSVEPFIALLLGVVAAHERLTTLVDGTTACASDAGHSQDVVTAHSLIGLAR